MSLEGMHLSRYKLLRLIGSGGMGEVYLAEHTLIAQQVAIKVIRAETALYPNTTEVARLFHREAEAVAKLDHPNILPLFDYGEERIQGTIYTYLVMPFRKEGSLANWLLDHNKEELRLSQEDIAHILHQAASALQHAHDHGIIHQDVKPSNFLIRNNKEDPRHPDLLLADFGISKSASMTSDVSLSIRGTPTYMAPEQWEGHAVPATDQYALANMAYELLAGRPPFKGGLTQMMYQHLNVMSPPPSTLNPSLSADVDAIILRALAKKPEDRFPSITAFANAFQNTLFFPTITVTYAEPSAPVSPKKSGGHIPFISAFARAFQQALKGNDIRVTLAISLSEALNGSTRILVLPGGQRMPIAIPAGTQDGRVLRIEGLDEPYKNSKLIVTIAISEDLPPPHSEDSSEATITAFNVNRDGSLVSYYQQNIAGVAASTLPSVPNQEIPNVWGPSANAHTFVSIIFDPPTAPKAYPTDRMPAASSEKLCPYCNSEMRPGDNFCLNCGNRIIPISPSSQQPQAAMQHDATIEAPNDWGLSPPTIGTRVTPSFSTVVPADQTAAGDVDSDSSQQQVLDEAAPQSPPTIFVAAHADLDQIRQQMQVEGDAYYKAKRYKDALNVYQRIIQLDDQDARAYGNKGNALLRLGRLKEALVAYTSALEIDSDHPSIWNSKGDICFKLRRYDEALEAYNQALSLSSEDALTWKTKGSVLAKLKLYPEALEAYETALKLRPKDDTTWAAKGNMLSNLERYEEALAAYTRSLEIAPKKAAIWEAKGDVYSKLKRYEEALYACERAHFLKPHDSPLFQKCTMLREMAYLNKQQKKKELSYDNAEDELKTRVVPLPDLPSLPSPPSQTPLVSHKRGESNLPPKRLEETMIIAEGDHYDVFLSHSSEDTEAVEKLAQRLMDEAHFNVWFSKWALIPGESWQRAMAYGMSQARCCAVCLGANTPDGWFKPAIEMALNRQAGDPSFRVFAVLLPGAKDVDDDYLKLYTWVNFCTSDPGHAFYLLVCGIKGVKPGRWPREDETSTTTSTRISTNTLDRLRELQQFKLDRLIDESIAVEYQRIVLEKFWLRAEGSANE